MSLKAEWLREALGQAVTHHHDHAGTALIKRWQDLFSGVHQQGPSTNPETESFHYNMLYGCANASLHSNAPMQALEEALNIVRDRVRVTAETGKRRPRASKRGDEREWRQGGKKKKKVTALHSEKRRKIHPIRCHEIEEEIIIGQRSAWNSFLQRHRLVHKWLSTLPSSDQGVQHKIGRSPTLGM